jgi:hypothetical protein
MIDLMNDEIPAPMATDPIIAMLNDMAVYDGEPPLMVLSCLISELKMWRAKDEYDKKMKMVMSNAIIKQLEKNGIQIEDDDE